MRWRIGKVTSSSTKAFMDFEVVVPEKTDENQAPNIMKIDRKTINQAIRPKSQHMRKISANLRYL
jgi:hypothetical protein